MLQCLPWVAVAPDFCHSTFGFVCRAACSGTISATFRRVGTTGLGFLKPGGRILIVPTGNLDDVEVTEMEARPAQSQVETNPLRRAVRRHQLARC